MAWFRASLFSSGWPWLCYMVLASFEIRCLLLQPCECWSHQHTLSHRVDGWYLSILSSYQLWDVLSLTFENDGVICNTLIFNPNILTILLHVSLGHCHADCPEEQKTGFSQGQELRARHVRTSVLVPSTFDILSVALLVFASCKMPYTFCLGWS